jgi:hypothetical protein
VGYFVIKHFTFCLKFIIKIVGNSKSIKKGTLVNLPASVHPSIHFLPIYRTPATGKALCYMLESLYFRRTLSPVVKKRTGTPLLNCPGSSNDDS